MKSFEAQYTNAMTTIYRINYSIIVALLLSGTCLAVNYESDTCSANYESYSYTQGFEGTNPVTFWGANGTYTVNALGITTAQAYSGTHSHVIDITINSGSYFYWKIAQPNVPCENILNFSGRILVEQISGTPTAGLGLNVKCPPTWYSGCSPFETEGATSWKLIAGDAVAFGKTKADSLTNPLYGYLWGAIQANIGIKADAIGIFIYGSAGDRIRVYLDDISLTGSVPTAASYAAEIINRWAPYKTRFNAKISELSSDYAIAQNAIVNLPGKLSPFEQQQKGKAQALLGYIYTNYNLTTISNRGWFVTDYDKINYRIYQAKGICDGIYLNREGVITRDQHLLYNVQPTRKSVRYVLPATNYIPAYLDNEIYITTTPGEYEPASFAIEAFSNLTDLTVGITDMTNSNAGTTLSASAIDIRAVKCWYQNYLDSEGYSPTQTNLVPELLLKDDTLIYVDFVNKANYINLNGNYVWISDPTKISGCYCPTNADFYVQDSATLLPVGIATNQFKQFWLTVNVPEGTACGEYTGHVTLINAAVGEIGKYPITINVLPFVLADVPMNISLCYRGTISATGRIGSEFKNAAQYSNDLINMRLHGVYNPTVYEPLTSLGNALASRQAAGLTDPTLYYLGMGTGDSTNPANLQTLKNNVTSIRNIAANYGITNVYIYGVDESRGDNVLKQREAWEAVHEAGGKVFSAGYTESLTLQYPWGKVGSWHLDEATGATNVIDSSVTYSNNGTAAGNPAWQTTGKIGTAVTLDGVDDYINLGNPASLNITNAITIEAWVYPQQRMNPSWNTIVGRAAGCGHGYWFGLRSDAYRYIYFYLQGVYNYCLTGTNFSYNEWSHVAGTYDGSKLCVYVNGVLKGQQAATGTITAASSQNLYIGYTYSSNYAMKGALDEVRIYNRALRSDEILENYQAGTNGKWTIVADLKDLHIQAGALLTNDATTCHSVPAHEIVSYGNPQVGVENPQIYRKNYGLELWRYDYDGAMDYAYQHSFGHGWNDFDHVNYRDHNFAYPTASGAIDTIPWEGFREGIDDLRYLATLYKVINEAPPSTAKNNAVAFVNDLKRTTGRGYDCWLSDDQESYWRTGIIYHILTLLSVYPDNPIDTD